MFSISVKKLEICDPTPKKVIFIQLHNYVGVLSYWERNWHFLDYIHVCCFMSEALTFTFKIVTVAVELFICSFCFDPFKTPS